MSAKKPKPAAEPAEKPAKPAKRGFDARDGLGLYIEHPENNPEGLVVEYDDDFVVINDKFPKARYPSELNHTRQSKLLTNKACTSSSSHATQTCTSNTRSPSSPPTLPS